MTIVHPCSIAEVADALEAGLRRRCEEVDREQAVYGLDVLEEIALHPAIELSLREAGFGVYREQRYPGDRLKRRLSHGERCDFVLTPDARALVNETSRGTLFDDPEALSLDEALWLEVKVVSQFSREGPNRDYSAQLLSAVREDVTKLAKDARILQAALLIVVFVREPAIAEHDLRIWQDRCLERGLPIGAPAQRCIPITDRHGHGCCVVSVYPVAHL
jgi:hypothetical protein